MSESNPSTTTSTSDHDRIEAPLDALTNDLARNGYPQSAQRICTRLFIAEFGTSGPLSQSTITEKTNLNPRTVRRQLNALEEDGYVIHHTDPFDPRSKLYRLTSLDLPG